MKDKMVIILSIIFLILIFSLTVPIMERQYFAVLIIGEGKNAAIPQDNIGFISIKTPIINIFQSPNPKDSLSLQLIIRDNQDEIINTILYNLGPGISKYPTNMKLKGNFSINYSLNYGNEKIDGGTRIQEVTE